MKRKQPSPRLLNTDAPASTSSMVDLNNKQEHDRVLRSGVISFLFVFVPFLAAISTSSTVKSTLFSTSSPIVNESGPIYTAVSIISNSQAKADDLHTDHHRPLHSPTTAAWPQDNNEEENESRTLLVPIENESDDDEEVVSTTTQEVIIENVMKPALIEVGALVIFQSFGLPVIMRLVNIARKGRLFSSRFFVSRLSKAVGRLFHMCKLAYKKTNGTKIVTRTKKVVKHILHHNHDDDEDHHKDDYDERHAQEEPAA